MDLHPLSLSALSVAGLSLSLSRSLFARLAVLICCSCWQDVDDLVDDSAAQLDNGAAVHDHNSVLEQTKIERDRFRKSSFARMSSLFLLLKVVAPLLQTHRHTHTHWLTNLIQ